jgi:class 3 adenylate cyclase/pimeloyl-ACP methyl ester carboxylesterase
MPGYPRGRYQRRPGALPEELPLVPPPAVLDRESRNVAIAIAAAQPRDRRKAIVPERCACWPCRLRRQRHSSLRPRSQPSCTLADASSHASNSAIRRQPRCHRKGLRHTGVVEIPPQTQYAQSGGVSIAFQVFGTGPPLVMAPLIPSHLDLMWIDAAYTQILRRLGSFARVVVFDPRGLGLSDPVDHIPTLEENADDIGSVLDAAGFDRAVIYASGLTCSGATLFAARSPERVSGLLLLAPWAQGMHVGQDVNTIVGWDEWMTHSMETWSDIVEHHWGEGKSLAYYAPGLNGERQRRAWGMLERASASPSMIRAIAKAGLESDTREVLPAVSAPTVVMMTRDGPQPEAVVRHVADLLPNSEFHILPASTESDGLESLFAPIIDLVERLVTGATATHSAGRILATVLFTDIVGSTEKASQKGDDHWRSMLDRHESILRAHVDAHGGRVVKVMGDGALSVFDGPARAIRSAQAFVEAIGDLGIEVRAGLHAGECETVGDDLAGLAVHIGARVGALAQPGEVWVSRTVCDLVAGSGMRFRSRGTHQLKGVPGSWEVYSLADGNTAAVAIAPQPPAIRATDRAILATARRAPAILRLAGRLALARR